MQACPVCRHIHLSKFNNICHFSDHLTNLSKSFCKCYLSPSLSDRKRGRIERRREEEEEREGEEKRGGKRRRNGGGGERGENR